MTNIERRPAVFAGQIITVSRKTSRAVAVAVSETETVITENGETDDSACCVD
jgi:hypothetical protein